MSCHHFTHNLAQAKILNILPFSPVVTVSCPACHDSVVVVPVAIVAVVVVAVVITAAAAAISVAVELYEFWDPQLSKHSLYFFPSYKARRI